MSAPTSTGSGLNSARGEVDGDEKRLRLPASEIDRGVLGILTARLRDPIWLNDTVLPPEATIDRRQIAITTAALLAERLQSPDPHEQRATLVDLLPTVRIGLDILELKVRRAVIDRHLAQEAEGSPELIVEAVPFVFRRRGVETRLVIEGQSTSPSEPDPALLKALARAHRWWDDLLNRRYDSLRTLAAAYDTDERYAARVLRLAFLPDPLVRSIIDGTVSPDVTLQSLLE